MAPRFPTKIAFLVQSRLIASQPAASSTTALRNAMSKMLGSSCVMMGSVEHRRDPWCSNGKYSGISPPDCHVWFQHSSSGHQLTDSSRRSVWALPQHWAWNSACSASLLFTTTGCGSPEVSRAAAGRTAWASTSSTWGSTTTSTSRRLGERRRRRAARPPEPRVTWSPAGPGDARRAFERRQTKCRALQGRRSSGVGALAPAALERRWSSTMNSLADGVGRKEGLLEHPRALA